MGIATAQRHRGGLERRVEDVLIQEFTELVHRRARMQFLIALELAAWIEEIDLLAGRQ